MRASIWRCCAGDLPSDWWLLRAASSKPLGQAHRDCKAWKSKRKSSPVLCFPGPLEVCGPPGGLAPSRPSGQLAGKTSFRAIQSRGSSPALEGTGGGVARAGRGGAEAEPLLKCRWLQAAPGPGIPDPRHYDMDSLVTVDVLCAEPRMQKGPPNNIPT